MEIWYSSEVFIMLVNQFIQLTVQLCQIIEAFVLV